MLVHKILQVIFTEWAGQQELVEKDMLLPLSLMVILAKRVGSKLKSRIVAEQSIAKWSQKIDEMEEKVTEVIEEDRAERALRKAEMKTTKAENMIAHKDEIYARPKRTWFMNEKEKKACRKGSEGIRGERKRFCKCNH